MNFQEVFTVFIKVRPDLKLSILIGLVWTFPFWIKGPGITRTEKSRQWTELVKIKTTRSEPRTEPWRSRPKNPDHWLDQLIFGPGNDKFKVSYHSRFQKQSSTLISDLCKLITYRDVSYLTDELYLLTDNKRRSQRFDSAGNDWGLW